MKVVCRFIMNGEKILCTIQINAIAISYRNVCCFFFSYQTAHLWSNGPLPGSDREYIFQRRPVNQENLPPEALLMVGRWYKKHWRRQRIRVL